MREGVVMLDLTLSPDEWLASLYSRALLRLERGEYRSAEELAALKAFIARCAAEVARRHELVGGAA